MPAGLYDTDFVDCVAFDSIASNTSEYCKKGDIVGVKGRVQSRTIENEGTKEKTAHRRDGCVKGFCYIGSCPLSCNAGAVSGRLSRSQYVFSTVRISDL